MEKRVYLRVIIDRRRRMVWCSRVIGVLIDLPDEGFVLVW